MDKVNWLQQGWECPKCGAVMSPYTNCCVNCRGNKGGSVSIATGSPLTIDEWAKQQTSIAPSSICSTSPTESAVHSKEAPKVKNDRFWAKSAAVGDPDPRYNNAAGGPPELNFDLSGYKEDPEEQWERYQLNV
jgi:hypothetical protein